MSLSLVLSLALWYPTLRSCLAGATDILAGSLRWALGFGLAWAAVGGIAALVRAYTPDPERQAQTDAEDDAANEAEVERLARRRDDFAFDDPDG